MNSNNGADNLESKIEIVNRIFIGVALLTVVALFIKPISNTMPMPKPMPQGGFDLMFTGMLGMCIIELIQVRYVVWQGLKKIETGNLNPEWPSTHITLIYSIGFGSMFPFVAAIMLYHLMGNTQMHAIIIAGMGGLNYINYLALSGKIRESAEKSST